MVKKKGSSAADLLKNNNYIVEETYKNITGKISIVLLQQPP
jgi:hypothetical protein